MKMPAGAKAPGGQKNPGLRGIETGAHGATAGETVTPDSLMEGAKNTVAAFGT